MTFIREREASYDFPRPIDNYIDGRGNNLPLFTMLYILLIPIIIYLCLFCFELNVFQLHFVLSIGFGLVLIAVIFKP